MRIYRIGIFATAVLSSILVAAWPLNAANAQAYWGYGAGHQRVDSFRDKDEND
jgi:hypothetical protein